MSNKKKNKIYIKRIISDISEISSDYDPKIHIWYDENNITKIRALIIGPENTPYEDGFFFFTIDIPESYPFNHPSAKFETINKEIRFNPNLYENGKVCLSILGTWSGPGWSPVMTLKSVLLSVESLFCDFPILSLRLKMRTGFNFEVESLPLRNDFICRLKLCCNKSSN